METSNEWTWNISTSNFFSVPHTNPSLMSLIHFLAVRQSDESSSQSLCSYSTHSPADCACHNILSCYSCVVVHWWWWMVVRISTSPNRRNVLPVFSINSLEVKVICIFSVYFPLSCDCWYRRRRCRRRCGCCLHQQQPHDCNGGS